MYRQHLCRSWVPSQGGSSLPTYYDRIFGMQNMPSSHHTSDFFSNKKQRVNSISFGIASPSTSVSLRLDRNHGTEWSNVHPSFNILWFMHVRADDSATIFTILLLVLVVAGNNSIAEHYHKGEVCLPHLLLTIRNILVRLTCQYMRLVHHPDRSISKGKGNHAPKEDFRKKKCGRLDVTDDLQSRPAAGWSIREWRVSFEVMPMVSIIILSRVS